MANIRKTSRFLSVAALAASTAISAPLAAYAQETQNLRLAQAEEEEIIIIPPEGQAPQEEPEPEPEAAPEPEPEPEVIPELEPEVAPEPEPAPAPEQPPVEEPVIEEPAPLEEPAQPEPAVPPAAETEPEPDAPVGEPEDLPVDEGTETDLAPAPETQEAPAAAEDPGEAEDVEPAQEPAATDDQEPTEPTLEPEAEEPATPAPLEEGEQETAPEALEPEATDPTLPDGETPVLPGDATETPETETPTAPVLEGETPEAGEAPATDEALEGETFQTLTAPETEAPEPIDAAIQEEPVAADGIAASDARVQNIQNIENITINSVTNIEGTPIDVVPQRALPPQVEVRERVGNRDILTIVGAGLAGAAAGAAAAYFIRADDTERLRANSEEFYVEQLPRGMIRETIVRDNGVQIVTITNRYGDVVQRSRIMPDGRESILFYDPYSDEDIDPTYYYDPGADLPPLRLTIPEEQYIVDVREPDPELYYRTIVAPPVESVNRIYSVDQVRRSERIRQKVRRIDLNTITFAFGSAEIEQSEVENLRALADAISRVLDDNPDETFLLEGHTDAVGSREANLALSDRRAESVAVALTSYFDIPPENLVTQGYGKEFLKVDTQEPNRENRRVALRRITPLVKPVETAQAN